MPRLDQGLHHLFGEERIATGARVDRLGQAARTRVVAEKVLEQLPNRPRPERRQRQPAVVRLLHPGGVILGAEVHHEKSSGPACRLDQDLEHRLAPAVEPVKVL
jgi:hypothetical protein